VGFSARVAPSPHVQVLPVGEDLAAAFEVAQEDLALGCLPAGEKVGQKPSSVRMSREES